MNQTETLQIIARLNLAGLLPAREGQSAVWHEDCGHLDYPTALEAARWIVANRSSDAYGPVKPGDLLDAVKVIRRRRIDDLIGNSPVPIPPVDPDDVSAYQAWQRAWLSAAGAGANLLEATRHADTAIGHTRSADELARACTRPVAALVDQVANGLGRVNA